MKYSSNEVVNTKTGNSQVSKIMLGNSKIFPSITMVYDNISLNVAETTLDLFINPSGTKLYSYVFDTTKVSQYSMSTAWDIRTATFEKWGPSSIDYYSEGITFSADGTKLYTCTYFTYPSKQIEQYSLSTPWDIGTMNTGGVIFVPGINPRDISFNTDGTKLYVSSDTQIQYYSLSTAWDITSATLVSSKTISLGQNEIATHITNDGKYIFILTTSSGASPKIYKAYLSTPFDISTMAIPILPQSVNGTRVFGFHYEESRNKLFIVSDSTTNIYQYSCS